MNFISPYKIKNKIISEGQNFQICKLTDKFGFIIQQSQLFYKFLMIIYCLVLMIREWKKDSIHYEINILSVMVFISILSFILFVSLHILEIDNYIYYFILRISINIIFAISNYVYIFYLGFSMETNNQHFKNRNVNINKLKWDVDISIIEDTSSDSKNYDNDSI